MVKPLDKNNNMTTINRFAKSRFADRGVAAEKTVQKFLETWVAGHPKREVERLVDTKAAGRIIKAAAADFAFYSTEGHGLIEVKETEHEYRLSRSKVSQLPRLRKREMCGGRCLVLVHHSTLKLWHVATAGDLAETGDKGSWNLTNYKSFHHPGPALAWVLPEIFA